MTYIQKPARLFLSAVLITTMMVAGVNIAAGQIDTPADSGQLSAFDLMTNYYNKDFEPFANGNWFTGFAFSLTDRTLENEPRLIFTVVDGDNLEYNLTFKGGYFLADNFMVGANFDYERQRFLGDVFKDPDTVRTELLSSKGVITPVIKYYFPLTRNNRLSFFNEIGLSFGFGRTLTRETRNLDIVNKSYTRDFLFSAGISPGITFFAIQNFAFEVQLNNLIGYTLNVTDSEINAIEESREVTNKVNFNIILLSLRLGLAYYFNTKKPKR